MFLEILLYFNISSIYMKKLLAGVVSSFMFFNATPIIFPISSVSAAQIENQSTQYFNVPLGSNFIPSPISDSKNKKSYFIDDPSKDLNKFSLYYKFDSSKLKKYLNLIDNDFLKKIILDKSIKKDFTSSKDLEEIVSLSQKKGLSDKEQRYLSLLQLRVYAVKVIQEKLKLEEGYTGLVDGIVREDFFKAIKTYQVAHGLKSDGIVGQETLAALNRSYSEIVSSEISEFRKFFAFRLFQSTFVINPEDLSRLVEDSFKQLNLSTPESIVKFLESNQSSVDLKLNLPENYLVKNMDLEAEIIKEKQGSMGTFRIYQNYKNNKLQLFETRTVLGGINKDGSTGKMRKFSTPNGVYYIHRVIVLPFWNPPGWAGKTSKTSRLPGPLNAYGLYMAEYFKSTNPVDYSYACFGDAKIRIHSTSNPNSVEFGGSSHGCTRLHPQIANMFFPFLLHYLPHKEMKYVDSRGDIIPFEKDSFLKVVIHD